jgi:hypothetical protein
MRTAPQIQHGQQRAPRIQEARAEAIYASLEAEGEHSERFELDSFTEHVLLRLEEVCREDRWAEEER